MKEADMLYYDHECMGNQSDIYSRFRDISNSITDISDSMKNVLNNPIWDISGSDISLTVIRDISKCIQRYL